MIKDELSRLGLKGWFLYSEIGNDMTEAVNQPEECTGGWDLANYDGVGEAQWFCIDCKAERPGDCAYRVKARSSPVKQDHE